jgi:hypothetical protein
MDYEEYGLNIEDLDMEVKCWGKLIGSILHLLKSILLKESIFTASNSMLLRKRDKTKLI